MKKIIYAIAGLSLIACNKEVQPVDYTLFSGKVTNKNSDKITLYKGRTSVKEITLTENGSFTDTLRLDEGPYRLFDGTEYATVYVKKGAHFAMDLDAAKFDESLSFSGEGASQNNYFAQLGLLQDELDFEGLISGDLDNFNTGVEAFKEKYMALLNNTKGLDSITTLNQTKSFGQLKMQLKQMFLAKAKFNEMKGKEAYAFNYDNVKGGKTSLADLKGKYVYIDVWATWCGPCKKEIPHLKEIEKEYHDKNIAFVSISVDAERAHGGSMEKAVNAWKTMVAEKELGGVQLHFGGDNEISKAFSITGIPRFILLDPQGKIVDADAPRPSSTKLKELFAAQGI